MNKLTPQEVFKYAHSSYRVIWMDDRHRVYMADEERKDERSKGVVNRKRVRIHLNVDIKPGDVFYREDFIPSAEVVNCGELICLGDNPKFYTEWCKYMPDPFDPSEILQQLPMVESKKFRITTT